MCTFWLVFKNRWNWSHMSHFVRFFSYSDFLSFDQIVTFTLFFFFIFKTSFLLFFFHIIRNRHLGDVEKFNFWIDDPDVCASKFDITTKFFDAFLFFYQFSSQYLLFAILKLQAPQYHVNILWILDLTNQSSS